MTPEECHDAAMLFCETAPEEWLKNVMNTDEPYKVGGRELAEKIAVWSRMCADAALSHRLPVQPPPQPNARAVVEECVQVLANASLCPCLDCQTKVSSALKNARAYLEQTK